MPFGNIKTTVFQTSVRFAWNNFTVTTRRSSLVHFTAVIACDKTKWGHLKSRQHAKTKCCPFHPWKIPTMSHSSFSWYWNHRVWLPLLECEPLAATEKRQENVHPTVRSFQPRGRANYGQTQRGYFTISAHWLYNRPSMKLKRDTTHVTECVELQTKYRDHSRKRGSTQRLPTFCPTSTMCEYVRNRECYHHVPSRCGMETRAN